VVDQVGFERVDVGVGVGEPCASFVGEVDLRDVVVPGGRRCPACWTT